MFQISCHRRVLELYIDCVRLECSAVEVDMWLCVREMWPGKYQRESVLPASYLEGADRGVYIRTAFGRAKGELRLTFALRSFVEAATSVCLLILVL